MHVHMDYGGEYRNTPRISRLRRGRRFGLREFLARQQGTTFPRHRVQRNGRDPASTTRALIVHARISHQLLGPPGLLGIRDLILPGYVGYPNTAASSLWPMNADVADIAHSRGALVGYVHPFDEYPEPIRKPKNTLTSELPVDVALGKVDYMEIVGFSDHRATAASASAAELGVSNSSSRRHRCHGELLVARTRGHESHVRARP